LSSFKVTWCSGRTCDYGESEAMSFLSQGKIVYPWFLGGSMLLGLCCSSMRKSRLQEEATWGVSIYSPSWGLS
jgi:hypothetical protein